MKLVPLLLIFIVFLPICYSIEEYVEQKMAILDNGDVVVQGTTSLDVIPGIKPENEKVNGITSELTTKKGKYWLFNYDSKINVSAAFIEVMLPKGAEANFVKSSLATSISSSNNVITIKFSGQDRNAQIIIQYILNSNLNYESLNWWLILVIALALIAITATYFAYKKYKCRSPYPKKDAGKINMQKLDAIKPTLNETQIKIIDALLEKKGEASQTTLMYMANIPKASLSRNLELLAQKEVVQKFFNGTSNYIKIHPSMKK
jgi:uncharacterized membrane protein